jgi:hypothetical protein
MISPTIMRRPLWSGSFARPVQPSRAAAKFRPCSHLHRERGGRRESIRRSICPKTSSCHSILTTGIPGPSQCRDYRQEDIGCWLSSSLTTILPASRGIPKIGHRSTSLMSVSVRGTWAYLGRMRQLRDKPRLKPGDQLWKVPWPTGSVGRYSFAMPARSINADHFLMSPSSRAFNCSGVLAWASMPSSA